jgi:hypothetical protein
MSSVTHFYISEQGIIAPVSETEDLLISSPIVLVSKRSKNASDNALLQQIVQMIPQNFPFERGKSIGFLIFPNHVRF